MLRIKCIAFACVAALGCLFAAAPSETQAAKIDPSFLVGQAKKKVDPKLKLILKKIDPEVAAARTALLNARTKLNAALNDEVFGEKGAVEGKVIDQLKLAIANVNRAIAEVNKAQKLGDSKE
jgi:Skp family chaperone for outer membrane proteins